MAALCAVLIVAGLSGSLYLRLTSEGAWFADERTKWLPVVFYPYVNASEQAAPVALMVPNHRVTLRDDGVFLVDGALAACGVANERQYAWGRPPALFCVMSSAATGAETAQEIKTVWTSDTFAVTSTYFATRNSVTPRSVIVGAPIPLSGAFVFGGLFFSAVYRRHRAAIWRVLERPIKF